MFTNSMIGELATTRHTDLIAAADAERRARQARQARRTRRDQGGSASGGHVRRFSLRTTTQPANP